MSNETMNAQAETGQTMAEYAVVLGVITLAIVTTVALLSDAIYDSLIRTIEIIETAF